MRVILVPMSDRPESKAALRVAAGIADSVGANLVGCHLRPHRDGYSGYKTSSLPLFGHPNQKWLDELGRKSTESAARRAEKIFSEITGKAGFQSVRRPRMNLQKGAIWQQMVGVPDKLMAIQGPVTDLTVVTRPAAKSNVARLFMMAALMHTSRPVLILPPSQVRAPGQRIAIAWNQSPEVMRVISGCMPMLQQAQQVTVLICGAESRLGPKAQQLQGYLKQYGVKSEVMHSRGRAEEKELLAAYKSSKSDLLLMGAYSRTRFREMVFGGMTEHMLTKVRIPVVMQHA
jgi:nucleotide-binding universal stress UspA family protein